MVAACFLGMRIGVVFKRWGAAGPYALGLAALLPSGAVAVLITWRAAWIDTWSWLTDRSVNSLTIGLPEPLIVAVAALTYLGLRHTVP